MKKSHILFIIFVSSLFVLSVTILSNSGLIWAQEEVKLMPMELDGTEWEVIMTKVTKKGKKKTSEDKLIFLDKKFISEKFEKKGYEPTNYSLMVKDDGATEFGTMQIKGKDTSFWKGIIVDNAINGSVHTQFSGGKTNKTTYFKGTLVAGELKRKVEKPTPPPSPPSPPPPVVQPEEPANPVIEKAKEAVKGAVEKVQDLVGSDSDDVTEAVGDVEEEVQK